ncbi:MAG: T9SS type A sorting domain-containing protein [Bacteroidota bacterium]
MPSKASANAQADQNYPNPFNPTTSIRITIGNPQFVSVKVYDMLGREVSTLINEKLNTAITPCHGTHQSSRAVCTSTG